MNACSLLFLPTVLSPTARRTAAPKTAPAAAEAPAATKTTTAEPAAGTTRAASANGQDTEHLQDENRQDEQHHQEHENARMTRNKIAFLIAARVIHRRRLIQRTAAQHTQHRH